MALPGSHSRGEGAFSAMNIDRKNSDWRTEERRREAVRRGRQGLGRALEITFEPVVKEPIPGYWLALLSAVEHRHHEKPDDEPKN